MIEFLPMKRCSWCEERMALSSFNRNRAALENTSKGNRHWPDMPV